MSFRKIKFWDNRDEKPRDTVNGRTWTRRVQWLENEHDQIKLEVEHVTTDGACYRELLIDRAAAEIVWKHFKDGQAIDDAVSIYGVPVPESMQSKRVIEAELSSPGHTAALKGAGL